MSFQDATLSFNTNWTTPQAVTATADSTCIVDLTGATQGKAPGFSPGVLPNIINGFPALNTAVGFDPGTGDGVAIPYLYVTVTTAGSSTSNTFQVNLLAAPDSGTGTEGSYTTLYSSAKVATSGLVKGSTLIVPVPPTLFNWPPLEALPRFLKVNYVASGALTVSVLAGIMLNPPSSLLLGQYNNNFTVV